MAEGVAGQIDRAVDPIRSPADPEAPATRCQQESGAFSTAAAWLVIKTESQLTARYRAIQTFSASSLVPRDTRLLVMMRQKPTCYFINA